MYAVGSGLYLTAHVKLIVLPLSTCKSGPPRIVAVGTVFCWAGGGWQKQLNIWDQYCFWGI